MGSKARVALFGKPGSIVVEAGATVGAILGVSLFNADGSLVTVDQFIAAGVSLEGIPTTDALAEGSRNLYYTDGRADARAAAAIATHVGLADPHTQYQPNLLLQDEGVDQGTAGSINTINFTGSGVTVSETGGVATVDVPAGGGGAGGALTYVGGAMVTGAAASSLTLSGLNLAADESYLVKLCFQNATGSLANLSLYFNGDTTATNYDTEVGLFVSTSIGASYANAAVCFQMAATTGDLVATGHIDNGLDGRPCAVLSGRENVDAAIQKREAALRWRTASNLTSITVSSSVANALAIGSYIRVWKLKV